jgi:ubiquitin carboxyl-terminal hydrolase 34
MLSYCSLCLKKGDKKNFLNLVSELYKIKLKEDEKIKSLSSGSNKEKKKIKRISEYIGIRNLGNLCYLNSIIQQLFYIPLFKYSIMDVDDKKEPIKSDYLDDDNLLHQIQKIFTQLTFTAFGEVIPKDLIFSIKDFIGNPIDPNEMQDSHEFFTNFCGQIEESLNNTKYKYLIKNLFIGKICNVNTCTSCKHITYRFEDFKDLTLEVNDLNDIYESLDKYISNEKIEDYFCSNCNKKVNLNKATLIANLPNILIIHLNRIKMNMVNGNFEKIPKKNFFFRFLPSKNYLFNFALFLKNRLREIK